MDLQQLAQDIPNYDVFLTIDELTASSHQLAAEFPDLVSIKVVGETRGGDPIELLTIAGGEHQALVFGGPHPNEPIGTMTISFSPGGYAKIKPCVTNWVIRGISSNV